MVTRIVVGFVFAAMWLQQVSAYAQSYRDTAFVAAQRLINSATSEIVSEQRLIALGSAEIEALIRQRRSLNTRLASVREALAQTVGSEADGVARRSRLLREELDIIADRELVNDEITANLPNFISELNQAPLSIEDVQNVLARNEALVVLVPTQNATTVFAVSDSSVYWGRSDLTILAVDELVSDVRASLSQSETTRGQVLTPSAQGQVPSTFDGGAAYQLYSELLHDALASLVGVDTLYIVRSGQLRALPFSVLMSQPPTLVADFTDLGEAHFLIDDYAIAEIPAIANLVAMQRPQPSLGGEAFNFFAVGAPVFQIGAQTDDPLSETVRGRANAGMLHQLAPLPGTRREIDAAISVLPSGSQRTVITGEMATEPNMRGPLTGVFASSDVVLLATHGLLGTEPAIAGVGEPGLVLSPPARADTPANDGFLSASEISSLQIGANLVILSACNTIGSYDDARRDGIGALSQSFFSAGAQAVIASHWSVDDAATADLMAKLVAAYAGGQRGPSSLRDAVLAARADGEILEPYQWGAFSYVGLSPSLP